MGAEQPLSDAAAAIRAAKDVLLSERLGGADVVLLSVARDAMPALVAAAHGAIDRSLVGRLVLLGGAMQRGGAETLGLHSLIANPPVIRE